MSQYLNPPGKQTLPFISVIIPVLNGVEYIDGCLKALERQNYPRDCFEIIIVDNGSRDGTFELLQERNVRSFLRQEKGRSKALNTALENAKGELICSIDISCRPEPTWMSSIARTFVDYPSVYCVAGEIKQLAAYDNLTTKFQLRNNYMSPMWAAGSRELPYMPFADGANASFRRRLFDMIGGFEESFIKGADVEICYRMLILTPFKIAFNRNAILWEEGEPNLKALLKQRFRIGLSYNLFKMKFPDLYRSNRGSASLKQRYWKLMKTFNRLTKLLAANTRFLLNVEINSAASDANIRMLMRWAELLGEIYGKIYLNKHRIRPEPIRGQAFEKFLSSGGISDHRVVDIS